MEFLYSYLPLPDMMMQPFSYWLAQTQSALKVRNEMQWGVPEKEFRHFVLPPRVNNEDLDDFRTLWADLIRFPNRLNKDLEFFSHFFDHRS